MHRLISIDAAAKLAVVEPGIVLDTLRAAAEKHHLTYAPDPATHNRCTLGGMIGNNSCGVHGLMGGKVVDNVESMDLILYDGTRLTVGRTSETELEALIEQGGRVGKLYAGMKGLRERFAPMIRERFPKIPRRVSGYNLDELLPENGFNVARALVGSEGTCATLLSATLNLTNSPPYRVLTALGFADAFVTADAVPRALEHGPIGLEGFDGMLVDFMRRKGLAAGDLPMLPEGNGFLLVEMGAWSAERGARPRRRNWRGLFAGLAGEANGRASITRSRRSGFGMCASRRWGRRCLCPASRRAGRAGTSAAVPPAMLGAYLRKLSGVDEGVWISQPALWALRAGVRAYAHQLRFPQRGGAEEVPRIYRPGGGPGVEFWWIAERGSMAMGRRGRRCCRRCLAPG